MSKETCILTTKDFTILEAMRNRCINRHEPLAEILARKLGSAQVMFREDLPVNVASVNSRVTFSVNRGISDTRVLSLERIAAPVGMFLPITTLRGLALLGLEQGQEFVLTNGQGLTETVMLETVDYQPEAVRREKSGEAAPHPRQQRPLLRLVRSGADDKPSGMQQAPDCCDDPGPSAA